MEADARIGLAPPRAHVLSGLRVTPHQAVAVIVAASVIGRTLASWLRATPIYFPDEYIYSEVGRSIAAHGRPLVRGGSAHFPALLQPLLTAPAWLFDDVGTSFRAIQLLNAVVMSLGAVAVFWLARRLQVSPWLAVAVAALTLAIPDMFYSAWVLADPIAFPFVLAAIAAATAAFERPSKRAQLVFMGFAVLATLARVQYVVLPACFVLAAIVIGIRERRLRKALREQRLVFGFLALGLLPALLTGTSNILGYYDSVISLDFSPLPILRWMGADGMLLLYSSGWVLVPGALVGLALALWKPRSRGEFAFAVFAGLFALAVVFEAALYAANGADRIQERYFFTVVPLVGLLFALYAGRGFPHRVPHALVAGAALALSAHVPLAGFSAADGKSNSPLLLSVGILEQRVGDVGLASLAVAIVVAALSLVAAAMGFLPRLAASVLVGIALAGGIVTSTGAVTFGHQAAGNVYDTVLWPDPSFVDHSGLKDVALLETPLNDRGFATEELFWNRSIDRLLLLPDSAPPDAFKAEQTQIAPDGGILVGGRRYTGPLLVDAYSATTEFRGARQVARSQIYRLLKPTADDPRLALYVTGRYFDGWLALTGRIQLWPEQGQALAGRLAVTFSLPPGLQATTVHLRLPGGRTQDVHVARAGATSVDLPVCSSGSWFAVFEAPLSTTVGERLVTVRATRPVFTPDPSAC